MLRRFHILILLAALAGIPSNAALAASSNSVVSGLDGDEMLKLRAGPGLGFRIIVGFPNGTMLRNHGCDRVGGTPWCKVSLKEARSLKGYVSGHYLSDR